jgi:hypothetical protein
MKFTKQEIATILIALQNLELDTKNAPRSVRARAQDLGARFTAAHAGSSEDLHIVDENEDEYVRIDGVWSWIDIKGKRRGKFASKEAANKDAQKHIWG